MRYPQSVLLFVRRVGKSLMDWSKKQEVKDFLQIAKHPELPIPSFYREYYKNDSKTVLKGITEGSTMPTIS